MQISSKLILNSAENILKDRKQEQKSSAVSGRSTSSSSLRQSEGLSQSVVESKLLSLQDSLRDVQKTLSREQARYSYLIGNRNEISDSLEFDGSPLFPELKKGESFDSIQVGVVRQIEASIHSLKSIQVEIENLYALKFEAPPNPETSITSLLKFDLLKGLDPERVARLTRS